MCDIDQNEVIKKISKDFMPLLKNNWNAKINSQAFQFLTNKKHMSDSPFPISQDLLKLKLYLDKIITDNEEAMKAQPSKLNAKNCGINSITHYACLL